MTLSWDDAADASSYDVCLATENISAPVDCASHRDGQLRTDVASPLVISSLTNDTQYYFVVIPSNSHGGGTPSAVVTATPTEPVVAPTPTGKLNDTGITWGGNYPSGNNTTCDGETVARQDCSHGRDATAADDSDGHAGFSFTKVGSNGKRLAIQNGTWDDNGSEAAGTRWACVKDNVTGLIWEVKTNDSGLHDRDDTYTWYSTDSTTNGGESGYARASDASSHNDDNTCHGYDETDPSSYCNTQDYVARVNAQGLCGAKDWRLPTLGELRAIASLDRDNPATDTRYFPNTQPFLYWSSSPVIVNNNIKTWALNFSYGHTIQVSRSFGSAIRLVRDGQ